MDDDELLAEAEHALTELEVAHGLSERQATILAALRNRLQSGPDTSPEETPEPADDATPGQRSAAIERSEREHREWLDDLVTGDPESPGWPP